MSSTIPCPGRQCDVEFHYADSAEAANCKRKTELRQALASGDGAGAVRSAAGTGPKVTLRDEHARPYNVTKKLFRMTPDKAPVGGMIVGDTEMETEQFSRYPRDEATMYYSIDGTSFSAHTGTDVEHSNYRSLLRDFPNDFVAVEGEFSKELLVREDQPISEDLAEILRGLETDYPVYDSDDHDALKGELYEASWDSDVTENLSDIIRENINRNHFTGDDEQDIDAWDFDRAKLKKIADEVIAEKQANGEDVLQYDGYGVTLIGEDKIVDEIVSRMNPDKMYVWETSGVQTGRRTGSAQAEPSLLVSASKTLDGGIEAKVERHFTLEGSDNADSLNPEDEDEPTITYTVGEVREYSTHDPRTGENTFQSRPRTYLETTDFEEARAYQRELADDAARDHNGDDMGDWDGGSLPSNWS